jgi:HD-like signal output (HDOD) protein
MQSPSNITLRDAPDDVDPGEVVHALVERRLAGGELKVPMLPEVAVRVVRAGPAGSRDARELAQIISSDPALSMYVMRIVASAAKRPAKPIVTLPHAVAWLGFDEVANIAFTLALQGKILDVKGQQHKARRLWRHALASALWSRQLAHMLAREAGLCYLCGLLHDIGKAVALGAVHDMAQRAGTSLTGEQYDRLIEIFHRPIAARVVSEWQLPSPVRAVTLRWDAYAEAGSVRSECNVVHVAHTLADFTLQGWTHAARDSVLAAAPYRDLGLRPKDGGPLFDSADAIVDELDRYLAP